MRNAINYFFKISNWLNLFKVLCFFNIIIYLSKSAYKYFLESSSYVSFFEITSLWCQIDSGLRTIHNPCYSSLLIPISSCRLSLFNAILIEEIRISSFELIMMISGIAKALLLIYWKILLANILIYTKKLHHRFGLTCIDEPLFYSSISS